jgi:hypothetical protein
MQAMDTSGDPAYAARGGVEDDGASLIAWHWVAGVAHLAQGIAALVLGLYPTDARAAVFRIPQIWSKVDWDDMLWVSRVEYAFPFVAVLSSCAFVSAGGHFLAARRPAQTLMAVAEGRFPRQWVEYAISSSIMMTAILMLCGVWDMTVLFVAAWCNALMCLTGIVTENMWTSNDPILKRSYGPFALGAALGLTPWALVFANLFTARLREVPPFVFVVIFGYLALFALFPAVMLWQFSERHLMSDTAYVQANRRAAKAYILLSLSAKALLLWGIIGGIQQPNPYADNA